MAKLSSSSDFFSETTSRLPDDTVFFSIFPDSSISGAGSETSAALQSLHVEIIDFVSPFTSPYIWQHEPFSLSIALSSSSCVCTNNTALPHLHGKLKYGDNLEDEWFAVFLLFRISTAFPSNSIRVWDTDGEFLLIEAAFFSRVGLIRRLVLIVAHSFFSCFKWSFHEVKKKKPCLQRNFTVRSSSDQENEIYGHKNTETDAEVEKTAGDENWLGLEGVTRVNSLVQLPRFSEEKSKT